MLEFRRLKNLPFLSAFCLLSSCCTATIVPTKRPYQTLHIPQAISGHLFELNLHKSKRSFWSGATTSTYSYNREFFWGPTLLFNKGETVRIGVKNQLPEPTTVHWHGMHLPAKEDGGPHQMIQPGTSWSASFTVMNHAAMYWYHPHPHKATQKQMTMGAGGLIIVRDPEEAKLNLPRTYGVDDIPLVLTSRRFHKNQEFSYEGDNDKYGDFELTNGTLDAQIALPRQFVRLRVLNAEIERGYNLGFSDNRTFYVIGNDGGLLEKPVPVKRLRLMVGERAELLVDLGRDTVGSSVDLISYNAGQPFGFPGAEPGNNPPNGGYLNNIDFAVLNIVVKERLTAGVTLLPKSLANVQSLGLSLVTNKRTIHINGGGPPDSEFSFDNKYFEMDEINQVVKLGATEAWTISNDEIFGHSFHIHDVQFRIISRSDGDVMPYERGWKDTVYVPRGASVTFVAKFEDFASDSDAFMYHCHMANHEDGGLMGQFLVVRDPKALSRDSNGRIRFRHQVKHPLTKEMVVEATQQSLRLAPRFQLADSTGRPISLDFKRQTSHALLFFIDRDCPCSRDVAAYLSRIQSDFRSQVQVLGIIDASDADARAWQKVVKVNFPIIPDPKLTLAHDYHVSTAATLTLITPSGRIAKQYPGYSATILKEICSLVVAKQGQKRRMTRFAGAPASIVVGCLLRK